MTVAATCNLVPDSRTARGSAGHATATINGVTYGATSQSSAVAALCRELVADSVPDGAMTVTFDGVAGRMESSSTLRRDSPGFGSSERRLSVSLP